MDGFALVIAVAAAFLAGAVLAAVRYERELRRMARFLERREPDANARMTVEARTNGTVRLARGVNAQLDALQAERIASAEARQAFQVGLVCLSHDIRTPLAGAQGYLQLIESEPDPAAKERYLNAVARRLDDVRQLLDDLFAFAQVQSSSFAVACEPVRPSDVLGEVLAGFYPQFRECGWEPSVDLDQEALAWADSAALARVFRNVVGNALRHGAASPVVEQRGATFRFSNKVANPASLDANRLFDRFYQADDARSRGGAGLGLAIVEQLTAAMGGCVSASLDGDVLCVQVELREAPGV